MAGKSSFLVQGQVLFHRAMASNGDLHMWGDAFVKEVLNNGRWNRPWHFIFQGLGGPDPWVIFILSWDVVPLLQYRKDVTMDALYLLRRIFSRMDLL